MKPDDDDEDKREDEEPGYWATVWKTYKKCLDMSTATSEVIMDHPVVKTATVAAGGAAVPPPPPS